MTQTGNPLEKRIESLKSVHDIQGTDGNWNSDQYMRGMFNGLELALAIMQDRPTRYRDSPDGGHINETDNHDFNRALAALLNVHGYDSRCNMHDFLLSECIHHVLVGLQYIEEKRQELRSIQEGTEALHEWKENNPPDQYKPGEVVVVEMSDTV